MPSKPETHTTPTMHMETNI